jgi:hypothetical protein
MKVGLQNGIRGYSGTSGEIVYCYNRILGTVYARKRVYPTLTAENERICNISGNLFGLQPSQGYKDDMYFYLLQYKSLRRSDKRIFSWSNLYMKLMYAMAKQDPTINLKTLTREEIYTQDLPCISVKKAVEARLLPAVRGYGAFTQEI